MSPFIVLAYKQDFVSTKSLYYWYLWLLSFCHCTGGWVSDKIRWIKGSNSRLNFSSSPHFLFSLFLQSLTAEDPAVHQPAKSTEKEDVHYAEIDFTKQRPEPSLNLDVLYAQVKVSKTPNSSTQTTDCQESFYAQVRKKWIYGNFFKAIILVKVRFPCRFIFYYITALGAI